MDSTEINRTVFLSRSIPKYITIITIIAATTFAASMHSYTLAITAFIIPILLLLRIASRNQNIYLTLLYRNHQWGDREASHVGVYTSSSKEDQHRHLDPKIFITKILHRTQTEQQSNNLIQQHQEKPTTIEIMFNFHGTFYTANSSLCTPMAQHSKLQRLRFDSTDLLEYIETGLNSQTSNLSKQTFATPNNYLSLSLLSFINRNLRTRSGTLTICLLLSLLYLDIHQQMQPLIIIGSLLLLLLLTIFISSIVERYQLKSKYQSILEETYSIVRGGETLNLAISDLLVGDVLIPDRNSETALVYPFSVVLTGQSELFVREQQGQTLKFPLKELENLENRQETASEKRELEEVLKKEMEQLEELENIGLQENKLSRFARKDSKMHKADSHNYDSPNKSKPESPLLKKRDSHAKNKGSHVQRKHSKLSRFESKNSLRSSNNTFNPSLPQNKAERYIIHPHSLIYPHQMKDSHRLIVTDPHVLNKYLLFWFEKDQHYFCEPLINRYQRSLGILTAILVILTNTAGLSLYLPLLDSFDYPQPFLSTLVYPLTVSAILLPLSFELLFLFFKAFLKVGQVLTPSFFQMGLTLNLCLDFQKLLYLEYEQILYKNKLLNFQIENFEPNAQTIKASTTYESLLMVVIYISLGKFDPPNGLLSQTYHKFQSYFQYEDLLGDYPDIEHTESNTKWQIVRVLPQDEQGKRSWIVFYDNKTYYLITEFNTLHRGSFDLLGEKEDDKKQEVYINTAKELKVEGKELKTVFFRNLKQQRLGQTSRPEGGYADWPRHLLQKNLEFACFLVFDHALLQQTVVDLDIFKEKEKNNLEISFVSQYQQQQLAGFEHILSNIPFFYGCTSPHTLAQVISDKAEQRSVLYIGGNHHDIQAFDKADIAVSISDNLQKNNQFVLPADIHLHHCDIESIEYLLNSGRWALDLLLQSYRQIILTTFTMIGLLFYFDRLHFIYSFSNYSESLVTFISLMICLCPMPLRLMFQSPKTHFEQQSVKPKGIFSLSLILCLCTSLIACLILLLRNTCLSQSPLTSRNNIYICTNLPLLLSTYTATINFSLFHQGQHWLQSKIHLPRLSLLIVWIGVMLAMGYDGNDVGIPAAIAGTIVLTKLIVQFFKK